MRSRGAVERTGWRAVVHAVVLGLSTGMLLVVAGLAVVLIVVPKATGSTPLTVLTRSMEPALPPGTLLVVRPVPLDDVRVGDVLTYQVVSGQPAVISHRVVAVTSSSDGARTFVVKGDANAEPDAPVRAVQVRGVLWYSLPGLGYVNQVVNGSRGWLVPLVAGVLITYGAAMVVTGAVSSLQRRRSGGRRRAEPGHGRRRARRSTSGSGIGRPTSGAGRASTRAERSPTGARHATRTRSAAG